MERFVVRKVRESIITVRYTKIRLVDGVVVCLFAYCWKNRAGLSEVSRTIQRQTAEGRSLGDPQRFGAYPIDEALALFAGDVQHYLELGGVILEDVTDVEGVEVRGISA